MRTEMLGRIRWNVAKHGKLKGMKVALSELTDEELRELARFARGEGNRSDATTLVNALIEQELGRRSIIDEGR